MKQKLLAALEQRYGGALGSKNEIYEKVVTAYGNLITSEEQIPVIVAGVEPLLKQFQSVNDKLRAFENKPKPEPTPKPSDNGNNPPEPNPEPKSQDTPDIAALIEAALDKKLNPITERLNNFETAQSQKSAVAALDELKATWDYAKGYPTECEDAYERVIELYEVSGKKWTADELTGKFKEKFNKAVSKKGIDTTQPFKSDGGAGENHKARFEQMAKRIEAQQGAVAGN